MSSRPATTHEYYQLLASGKPSTGALIMTVANMLPTSDGDDALNDDGDLVYFRLYVSGGAPNSVRAISNLQALCQEYLPKKHRIEIIDSLQKPAQVLNDHILLTPTLVKVLPLPTWQFYGDLSATSKILLLLGIEERSP